MSTESHRRSADEADTSSLKRRKAAGGAVAADDDVTVNGSTRPADWPAASGEIDLALHDLPHASSDTEWWYVNLHVTAEDGRQFSGFASFFRIIRDYVEEQKQYRHVHALTWGLIDPANKKYCVLPILDVNTPAILKRQIDSNEYGLDPMMMAAFKEMVDKGQVPLPDRTFSEEAKVPVDHLDLHYETNYFTKDANGAYHCHCEDKAQGIAYTLAFTATKPVTRHGHGGVVKIARKGEDMFYYFIPRMSVEGTVTIGGETLKVKGQGWYDHEFGGAVRCGPLALPSATNGTHANGSESKEATPKKTIDYSWNWLAAQLDDGTDISATLVHNYTDKVDLDNFALVIRPDGRREEFNTGVALTAEKIWQSVRTAGKYPVRWRLTVPDAKIDLVCEAPFPEQECITILAKPAFWEGLVLINGTIDGRPVKGRGFIERHGFHDNDSLDKFFKTISKIVQGEISALLPVEPNWTQTRDLMAREDMNHLMDGVDLGVFSHTLIKPLREIVDRGGKSWRSYALMLCADAVGGSSYHMQSWLSMPEIMHVGSLIVDDIQDRSLIRRGGPTVHAVYGEPLAINCGTAAYFIGTNVMSKHIEDPVLKVRIYELYFLTLRAGHAGQAFDIHGLDYLMDEAVASGNNDKLVRAIICTHRLKSAVPAGNLARMGAILGGGSETQIEMLGRYFESVGVAFQIIDDVLNLKGFEQATKDLGEDIKAGKITHPVCLAIDGKRLTLEQRKWMWETIKSKPQDQAVVNKVIELISSCGALAESEKVAGDMVDAAWHDLDPVLPPSTYKLRMRAFGFYVLRRHY